MAPHVRAVLRVIPAFAALLFGLSAVQAVLLYAGQAEQKHEFGSYVAFWVAAIVAARSHLRRAPMPPLRL